MENEWIGYKELIKFGGQDLKENGKMKQESLSPCYSTNLKDIITINCR
jgi:DNA polymerase V